MTSLRDDDPKLVARMEVADTVPFAPSTSVAGVMSDPDPLDGLKTWAFDDTVVRTAAATRVGRVMIELLA